MSDNNAGKTSSDYKQFSEFGGIIDLDINIRIPNSYYEAVKEYCSLSNTPVREWINSQVIDAIEAIELGHLTDIFVKKHNLRGLSREKQDALMQAHRTFTLKGETLNDG
jgi:hypothetical protein